MCPLPWWISELLHNWVFPRYVLHIIFLLVDCVGTCAVPLKYSRAWINRPPVFDNSIWCWCHSIVLLPSLLILDNALVWNLSSGLHVFSQHILPQIHQPPINMLLVSTCASICLVCVWIMITLWVPISGLFADWRVFLPVGGHTFPSKFHSIYIRWAQGSWVYIPWWYPLVGYQ